MGKQVPADDQEQLRQLIREGHETIKDMRLLLRECQQARAVLPAEAEKLINSHIVTINDALNDATAHVQKVITKQEEQMRKHYGELLSEDSATLILRTCCMLLHLYDSRLTLEEWISAIRARCTAHLEVGCSCLGCITVNAARPDPYAADIIVTTPDMVDEVRKRDPSRIVIGP